MGRMRKIFKAIGLLRESSVGMIGVALVAFWVIIALVVGFLPLRDPLAQSAGDLLKPALTLAEDGGHYWLGTDDRGRDILSRLFFGSRLVLFWSSLATIIAYAAGMLMGVTAGYRGDSRVAVHNGCTYLLPTIIYCGVEHSLANREFLFPFASVVEVPESTMPECLGSSLVVTAITNDQRFRNRLLASSLVGRLNLGAIQTNHISWDQPHEGNLFEHLYARRAFQAA